MLVRNSPLRWGKLVRKTASGVGHAHGKNRGALSGMGKGLTWFSNAKIIRISGNCCQTGIMSCCCQAITAVERG